MANFYEEMQAVAADVLAEFKQGTVIYVGLKAQAGATPDDPGEPVETQTAVNAAARAVSTKYVDGTHIVQSDRQVTMPGNGPVPDMNGYMLIDGVRYKIVEIMPIPAAGTPVTFILIVRR